MRSPIFQSHHNNRPVCVLLQGYENFVLCVAAAGRLRTLQRPRLDLFSLPTGRGVRGAWGSSASVITSSPALLPFAVPTFLRERAQASPTVVQICAGVCVKANARSERVSRAARAGRGAPLSTAAAIVVAAHPLTNNVTRRKKQLAGIPGQAVRDPEQRDQKEMLPSNECTRGHGASQVTTWPTEQCGRVAPSRTQHCATRGARLLLRSADSQHDDFHRFRSRRSGTTSIRSDSFAEWRFSAPLPVSQRPPNPATCRADSEGCFCIRATNRRLSLDSKLRILSPIPDRRSPLSHPRESLRENSTNENRERASQA